MLRLLLVAVLVDLGLLVWAGGAFGVGPVVVVVLATAVLGAWIINRTGIAMWWSARQHLAQGRLPGAKLGQGALLVAAGALLISPGLVADVAGLVLLVPAARERLRRRIAARLQRSGPTPVRVQVWR